MPILSRIRVANIKQLIEALKEIESLYPEVEFDSDIILEVEETLQIPDGSTITTLVVKQ